MIRLKIDGKKHPFVQRDEPVMFSVPFYRGTTTCKGRRGVRSQGQDRDDVPAYWECGEKGRGCGASPRGYPGLGRA